MSFGGVGRYIAHPDGLTATANLVAVIIAWNTPFYPLYVWWAAGASGMPWALLSLCSLPFFAAIPALSRRSSRAGRIALPVVGTVNTLFCTWLLGEPAGEQLFLLPCATLGAMLFRPAERVPMLGLAVLPLVAYVALEGRYPAPPHQYDAGQYQALLSMNALSVGCLTIFLGLLFARRAPSA
jgi:hypothetical protein